MWATAAVKQQAIDWSLSTLSCATTGVLNIRLVSLLADRKSVNRLIKYACGLFFEFLMCFPERPVTIIPLTVGLLSGSPQS